MADKTKNTKDREQTEDRAMTREERRKLRSDLRKPAKCLEELLIETYDRVRKQKAPVAELIRLLQYQRELGDAAKVKEIEVRWVEPSATDDASRG